MDEYFPLRERAWLYQINLVSENQERYIGLYNAYENSWAIPPIHIGGNFIYTCIENWIYLSGTPWNEPPVFFNIKTREKYTNMFILFNELFDGQMTYMGYCKDKEYRIYHTLNNKMELSATPRNPEFSIEKY
jgi:hypothetical protein